MLFIIFSLFLIFLTYIYIHIHTHTHTHIYIYIYIYIYTLWPPDANSWFIGKDPDAGKDWRQKEKRATEDKDEMVGWHHQFNGHKLEQTPRESEGQESLVCCSPRGQEESDMTRWQNNNNSKYKYQGEKEKKKKQQCHMFKYQSLCPPQYLCSDSNFQLPAQFLLLYVKSVSYVLQI